MSGSDDTGSSPAPGDIGALLDRANKLLNRGLDLYAQGDLLGALSEWEHAQALLPENDLAGEYISFVSGNFDVLLASFEGDENAQRAAAELDIPFGLAADVEEDDEDDDDDAYEMVVLEEAPSEEEVALRQSAEALARSLDAAAAVHDWETDLDTGWALPADVVDALPPPPSTAQPNEIDLEDALAEVNAGLMAGLAAPLDPVAGATEPLELELGSPQGTPDLALPTPQGGISMSPPAIDMALGFPGDDVSLPGPDSGIGLSPAESGLGLPEDDEPELELELGLSAPAPAPAPIPDPEDDTGEATVERRSDMSIDFGLGPAGGGSMPRSDTSTPAEQEEPEEPTVELRAHRLTTALEGDDEVTVPGGEEPPPFNPSIQLSDDALAALSVTGDGAAPEDPTVDRPGAGRFPLPDIPELGELDGAAPRDDRIDLDDELQPEVKVTFRGHAGPTARRDLGDDEPTVDRGMMLSLDEDEQTIERGGGGWPTNQPVPSRAPTVDPLLAGPNVIVDDHLLAEMEETGEHRALLDPGPSPANVGEFNNAGTPTTSEIGPPAGLMANFGVAARVPAAQPSEVAEEILEDLGRMVVAGESDDERTRRRVTMLIQRGAAEDKASNPAVAATAIDLALSEQPESIVAQKVIHRHRDLVIEVFRNYIGDLSAIPTLALPMHEIPRQALDNRSAFLLSRIDGSISFDEILDVAGMTQLEALRLLCKMLLNGILHVV